jgi:hypothetical protein
MANCTLSIIIVSWNVRDLLCACLASIERVSRGESVAPHLRAFGPKADGRVRTLEVIVIDNASSDGTPAQVALQFPWVRLIPSEHNLGFTAGNNRGFAASRGEFVFFLNPDAELKQNASGQMVSEGNDTLSILVSVLECNPTVGMVGPRLRYGDGQCQESRRRFPTPLTGFFESTWLGRAWSMNPWAAQMHMADWPDEFSQDVDWLVGAAMFCRRSALADLSLSTRQPAVSPGPFDEGFFMYSEEVDLCRRLKLAGWRVLFAPEAEIIHHQGKSSEQATAARHIHFNRSKVRYWRKWFGPRWSQALRRYLLLEFRVQWWLEGAKWLAGNNRPLRRQRMAVYRQVIQTRLV